MRKGLGSDLIGDEKRIGSIMSFKHGERLGDGIG